MRWLATLALCSAIFVSTKAVEKEPRGTEMNTEDSRSPDSMLETADTAFQKGDLETASELYQATINRAREEFNRSVEVEALCQMARIGLKTAKKDEGAEWLEKAAALVSDSDPMGYSRFLGVRGRFEWQRNDLTDAYQTFNEMYIFCNTNALWSRAVDAAHMIAIVASDPQEQIEWGRRGIETAEAGGAEHWLGPLWNNLAGTYYDLKQYDLALDCYIQAREYHWRFSGETGKLFADYHVGMTLRLVGKLDEAETWLRPVLAWAERLKNHSAIGQACEDLGEIMIKRSNMKDGLSLKEGLSLLRRAESEYREAGYAKSWPELIDNIAARIKSLE